MKTPRLQGYFWKALITISVVSFGFMAIVISTLAYYMVLPLGRLAVNDFTSIITHASDTWEKLPAEQRESFSNTVYSKHDLLIIQSGPELAEADSLLPYLFLFKASLKRKIGADVRLMQSKNSNGEIWFWVDIPVKGESVRFGFPRSRIRVQPSNAFFLLLFTGLLLMIATATYLARRLTRPIERLSQAAQIIGKGRWPNPIPETGPEELKLLAQEFNRMSLQIKELLTNRTTLLAGISHDLRTPLTQIQLALEMLPNEGGDAHLMSGIRRDLDAVNQLIGQALEIGMQLEKQETESVQVSRLLEPLVLAARKHGCSVEWQPNTACILQVNRLALQRSLANLFENAMRYGENQPISVNCHPESTGWILEICDRGPGIPAHQKEAVFQPFYRLETSRNRKTGGSGLGLAIVHLLATANDWEVRLLDHEGGGTCAQIQIMAT